MLDSKITRLFKKYSVTSTIDLGVHWLHAPHFDWHCAFIPKEDIDYVSIAIMNLKKVIKNRTNNITLDQTWRNKCQIKDRN